MAEELVIGLGREALKTVLLVAGPLLLVSLAVGVFVSILQATTQIQEQTLAFVPKIVVVLASVVLFGPWMLRILRTFATSLFVNLNTYVF